MKKIAFDLLGFVRDSTQSVDAGDDWIRPIGFTLADEARLCSPKDEKGLPIRRYRSVDNQYNPTRISGFALGLSNRFHGHGKEVSRETFARGAHWLHERSNVSKWFYHLDRKSLKAPWISCMPKARK